MTVRVGRAKGPSPLARALMVFLAVLVLMPAGTPPADAILSGPGHDLGLFYLGPTGIGVQTYSDVKLNNQTNQVLPSQLGFRFPASAVGVSGGFDLTGEHAYKPLSVAHQGQSDWQAQGGWNASNVTMLFGLRLDLDRGSPFYAPNVNDVNDTFTTGSTAHGLASGDFNSDGRVDLVVLDGGSVVFRMNTPAGFITGSSFPYAGSPVRVRAADLNLDGRMDVLVGTNTGQTSLVQPILQTASGTLRSEGTNVANGDTGTGVPNDMAVGDLSGDGYPDVAFSYSNRTAYWVNAYGGKNIESWATDDFSVAVQVNLAPTRVNDIRTSPVACGQYVAAGLLNNDIIVYRASNLTVAATLTGVHTQQINSVRWAPNCAYLVASASDRTFSVWNAANWSLISQVIAHQSAVYGLAVSPDSMFVATGGSDGFLKVWDMSVPSLPTEAYNVTEDNGTINTLAFSPDGTVLAAGTRNNTVRLRTTVDYSLTDSLDGHTGEVRALAFTPDSQYLVSGSDDDRAIVWNMSTLTQETSLTQSTSDINRLNINPQGTLLLTGGYEGRARVYRTSNWTVSETLPVGSLSRLFGVDFDHNGTGLLTGGEDNIVRRYDKLQLVNPVRVQTRQEFSVRGVSYGPGSLVASGSDDGTIAVTDTSNSTVLARFVAHNGSVNAVQWSPSGLYVASAGSDGRVKVWAASNWALQANLTLFGNVTALDFSADGSTLVAGNATGGIAVYSTAAWTENIRFFSGANVTGLALDVTGATIAAVGGQASVRLINAATGANMSNLTGGAGVQRVVDWSPDGTRIASGGNASFLNQWWTSNSTFIAGAAGHNGSITAVAFSPDSSRVSSGGADRRIFTWDASGTRVQSHSVPQASNYTITSISWQRDGRAVTAGWNDTRYPFRQFAVCTSGCPAGVGFTGITIADGNAAAGLDIIAVGSSGFAGGAGGAYLYHFGGTGQGTWQATHSASQMSEAAEIAMGDMTGDGHPDIAVATGGTANGNLYLQAWDSTNNIWIQTLQTVPVPGQVTQMEVADVTDDGHPDVVMASGGSANRVVVAFWENLSRPLGTIKITNISRFDAPVASGAPTGLAIADFNGDGLLDAAVSNGIAASVWVYHQKDSLYGHYISWPFVDPLMPFFPFVSARLQWTDFNVIGGETGYNASVSVNAGFTWSPAVQNQTINFSGSGGAALLYRFDFFSSHAGVTAWIIQVIIHYTLETTMQNPYIDVANDGVRDWSRNGSFLGTERVTFAPDVIDRYIADHKFEQDANGTVFVPIGLVFVRPAGFTFSNLSVKYNDRAEVPTLISPGPGAYATANPIFVLSANDGDFDRIWYDIQISREPLFLSVLFEYNQLLSTNCYSAIFYLAGINAECTSPDPDRLVNGQLYWWRARAWDGQQYSDWADPQNFTVDDQPPEGAAVSPAYSTIEQFTVSWFAIDAPGGAGLAAAPYDVQYKVGLLGAWVDWQNKTSATSAQFSGVGGATYCFRMRALDAAGNQQLYLASGDTCTTVDIGRPTASNGALAAFQPTRTISVSWTGSDGATESGVGAFRVEVQINGGAWTVWLASATGTSAAYTASDDSTFCFRVAAIDNAGNVGDPTAPMCTEVDTTPPVCTVTVGYATTTSLDRITATILCTETDTALAGYEVGVGTVAGVSEIMRPVSSLTPPSTLTNLSLENGGTYFVNVRGKNVAGAFSAWVASTPVRVVIPGPVSIIQYPEGVWTSTNTTLILTTSDELGFNVVAVELQYRRAVFRFNQLGTWEDWRTLIANASDTSAYFDSLVRGYGYEFRYRARNEVGSWGNFATGQVMYVNQLPIPNAGADRIVGIQESVDLDASASLDYDGARDNLTYSWESDNGEIRTGSTATFVFTTAGTHSVTLSVNDGHENTSAVLRIYVEAPPQRPILPGFEGSFAALALVAVALGAAMIGRRRRR